MARFAPVPGYGFRAGAYEPEEWFSVPNDEWEIVCISRDEASNPDRGFLGIANIDGAPCAVFRIGETLYAQTCVATRLPEGGR